MTVANMTEKVLVEVCLMTASKTACNSVKMLPLLLVDAIAGHGRAFANLGASVCETEMVI